MNLAETAKVVALLQRYYPHHATDEGTVADYQRALADVPSEDAMAAAMAHVKQGPPYFPKPSELRDAAAPRLDPADYRGDAYLDVRWMRHGMRRAVPATVPLRRHGPAIEEETGR